MMSDWQLLREYAQKKSEAAFAELVKKHMSLVYGTCWRGVGDAQLAEDATQAVFLLLAQKAGSLGSSVSISGWLFTAARLISRSVARGEMRRRRHEDESFHRMIPSSSTEPGCQEIEPWLNDALAILTPGEREVILMRYFDDLSYQEIATQIGTVENTAGKRARYAIDKMRRFLLKQGIVVSSAGLATLLAHQRSHAAPASCHAATLQAIHQLTVHPGSIAVSPYLTIHYKGVYLTMQAAKYKYLIAGAVALLILGGVAVPLALRLKAQAANAGIITPADASSLAAKTPTEIARKEIVENILTTNIDMAQDNWKDEAWDAPNRAIVEGDHKSRVANRAYYAFWNGVDKPDGSQSQKVIGIRPTTFQINGDRATIRFNLVKEITILREIPGMQPSAKPGTVLRAEFPESSEWQKINGRWMDIGPDYIPIVYNTPH